MTMKNKWALAVLACVFLIMGVYVGTRNTEQHQETANAVNQLFTTSLADISGKTTSLGQWRGKVLVVNFWATWCHPCVEEMPELSTLQTAVAQKNIQIIGIGIDSAPNIAAFSKERKISYPLYVGDTQAVELAKNFGDQAGGLPFTVLIDTDGHVQKTYLGRLKLSELKQDLKLQ